MTDEEWKPVVGFEGRYEVSTLARIRSVLRECRYKSGGVRMVGGKPIAVHLSPTGYYKVRLWNGESLVNEFVHRLVAVAFLTRDDIRTYVNHKSGVKSDSRLCNLEWQTQAENRLHATRVLRKGVGEGHGLHKLTEQDVIAIRRLRSSGLGLLELSSMFGCTMSNISAIANRETWTHVA